MRQHSTPNGFTLIELLLVMVIIGILAVISVSVFWSAKNRGFEAAMQSDLKTAAIKQELFFEAHTTYAASSADLTGFSTSPGVTLEITYAETDGWAGITRHESASRQCGLLVGAAPEESAAPADAPGIVQCGEP
jgi:prepilin-type N-terminal cleavage/methylation domain-containing protein